MRLKRSLAANMNMVSLSLISLISQISSLKSSSRVTSFILYWVQVLVLICRLSMSIQRGNHLVHHYLYMSVTTIQFLGLSFLNLAVIPSETFGNASLQRRVNTKIASASIAMLKVYFTCLSTKKAQALYITTEIILPKDTKRLMMVTGRRNT